MAVIRRKAAGRRFRRFKRRPLARAPRWGPARWVRSLTQGKIYRFKRALDGTNVAGLATALITQGAAAQNLTMGFQLQDIPSYTEYTALFDQYKLNFVVIKLIPQITNVVMENLTMAGVPPVPGVLYSVIDYDDNNSLSTANDYRQYQNFRLQPVVSPKTHVRKCRPRCLSEIWTGGSLSPVGQMRNQWLDCASANIPHYGCKVYIPARSLGANYAQSWAVELTYYLSFRNVR